MIKNVAEYEAIALRAIVETPYGPMMVCGKGISGSGDNATFSVAFGNFSNESTHSWSTENGFETRTEVRNRIWDAVFLARTDDEIALLNAAFGAKIASDERHALKTADKLVDVAKRQLIKAGKLEADTCGRCGGSGHYSYNQTDGTKCFGCSGSGKKMPSTKDALKAIRCE